MYIIESTIDVYPIVHFHPLEVVSRWRDPQLQVSQNEAYVITYTDNSHYHTTYHITFLNAHKCTLLVPKRVYYIELRAIISYCLEKYCWKRGYPG